MMAPAYQRNNASALPSPRFEMLSCAYVMQTFNGRRIATTYRILVSPVPAGIVTEHFGQLVFNRRIFARGSEEGMVQPKLIRGLHVTPFGAGFNVTERSEEFVRANKAVARAEPTSIKLLVGSR